MSTLWRIAADTGTTFFGTSAPFITACDRAGVRPADIADLSRLRAVGSTGAPLPARGFRWVRDAVGPSVHLASVSGGTDVCTAFVGMSRLLPVRAGEISTRHLGCAVEAFGADGTPVPPGTTGELVITAPMPSMPVAFWGDDEHGSAMRAAYFEDFPGVWRHGDWITFTDDGACTISGRSDATLNRGGVRLGTSDFYSVVEAMPGVRDSLVVHLEDPAADETGMGRLRLFVVLDDGVVLDSEMDTAIRRTLRTELSPRHVPDVIDQVPAVPRTLSGKKLEVPVKRILEGRDPEQVVSRDSLVDPVAIDWFVAERKARNAI
jgi:acetoacetyl-CoA synthetase